MTTGRINQVNALSWHPAHLTLLEEKIAGEGMGERREKHVHTHGPAGSRARGLAGSPARGPVSRPFEHVPTISHSYPFSSFALTTGFEDDARVRVAKNAWERRDEPEDPSSHRQ